MYNTSVLRAAEITIIPPRARPFVAEIIRSETIVLLELRRERRGSGRILDFVQVPESCLYPISAGIPEGFRKDLD
jgi:hypothetical protein